MIQMISPGRKDSPAQGWSYSKIYLWGQLLITSYLGDCITKMKESRSHQNNKYWTRIFYYFFFKKQTYKQHVPPHASVFMFSLCSAHTDLDTGWSQQGWLNTGTGCPEIRRDFKHWRYSQLTWSRPWVIWAYLKVRSSQVSREPGAIP